MLIDNVHENYDISNFLTEAYRNPGEYFDTMLLRGYFTRLLFLGSDLFIEVTEISINSYDFRFGVKPSLGTSLVIRTLGATKKMSQT